MTVLPATVKMLYLIEFLHQTTTFNSCETRSLCCILLNFYIKPQLCLYASSGVRCCILLNFYIKPQPRFESYTYRGVVSYWISTSNHNSPASNNGPVLLYLIEFLHQTTTSTSFRKWPSRLYLIEFLHQTTTVGRAAQIAEELYLIEFLHQTTTSPGRSQKS